MKDVRSRMEWWHTKVEKCTKKIGVVDLMSLLSSFSEKGKKIFHIRGIWKTLCGEGRAYFKFLVKKSAKVSQGMRFLGSPLPLASVQPPS